MTERSNLQIEELPGHDTPESWKRRLHTLAYAPLKTATAHSPHTKERLKIDSEKLNQAYSYCSAITAEHSKTFYLASRLLPKEKQRAAQALYAFCRISDDLVDLENDKSPDEKLEAWRSKALNDGIDTDNLVALAWSDTRFHYQIPIEYSHQLIDGIEQDIRTTRYTSFDDLAVYAYGVASTVGIMAMHIIGYTAIEAIDYAVKLGIALQLTNILWDVGEDWRRGRLYLPLDELTTFGITEADIAMGYIGERWRYLMQHQIARNRKLYAEALPGIAYLHNDGRFSIAAAAELYRAILSDIEAHNYDVYNRRSYVSKRGKLMRLPGIWWRSRYGYRLKPKLS